MLRSRRKHSASLINFEKAGEEEKHTFNGLEPNTAIVAHYCVRSRVIDRDNIHQFTLDPSIKSLDREV